MTSFVKINEPGVDLAERATSRTLLQFRKSTVFLNVLQAFIQEVQHLQGGSTGTIDLRGPADAFGENLDVLGRIVGQTRVMFDYSAMAWFTPDNNSTACDVAPAWVETAPVYGRYLAGDVWFRELIQARIFRNFAYYGSVPEIATTLEQALGTSIGFYRIGPMEAQVVVPLGTPIWIVNFILRSVIDSHIDLVSFAPFPATLNVTQVLYAPPSAFAPDVNDGMEVDSGLAAVGYQGVYLGVVL